MEHKIPRNPASAQPPESFFNNLRSLSADDRQQTPLMQNLHFSDPGIVSALGSLSLSQDFRHPDKEPSFAGTPATFGGLGLAESLSTAMTFGETSYWALPTSDGGINGPSGAVGAHQNINVGPGGMSLFGGGPYFDTGDHPQELLKYQRLDFRDQRLYFCDDANNFDLYSLHGKKQLSRKPNNYIPILPSSRPSNMYGSVDSSRSSLYSNQQFCQWQQQLTFENLRGDLVCLAKDQVWSGVLKSKLEEGLSEREIDMVLLEVMEFLDDLMRSQFGNHFVQKLFTVCNEVQRTRIITVITKFPYKLVNICHSPFGARAMQKLLERLMTPQQIFLVVCSLSLCAVALANDPNGQHVIQYCVKNFPGDYNKQIFNEIANNCFKIAINKSGCCVIQACVEHSHGELKERLVREIIANAVQLAEDPYGNYVVQHLLALRMEAANAGLLRRFQGFFVSLSCNKYASNVVEKFLTESGENHAANVILELVTSPNASMLLVDPYGNFVIQTALSKSKGPLHDALLNLIQADAASMQNNLYGKKILAWFEKRKKLHIA